MALKCFFSVSIFIVLSFSLTAHAGLYGEFDGTYFSDSFTTSTTATNSKTYYGLNIIANLDTKERFYGGFHVSQMSFSDTGTTTTTMSSLDMGPMLTWVLSQKNTLSLELGVNVTASGQYVHGSTTETITGMSYYTSLGVMPEFAENWYVGFRLYYYSLTYSKSVVTTTSSDVSYSRALIFPTFSIAWRH